MLRKNGKTEKNSKTVNIHIMNSDVLISTIFLKKQGAGYVGPRGKYYDNLPRANELKLLYGF